MGKNINAKKGFTLAETLITLVILGVVAAIVVSSILNPSSEKQNKVKIRKALASYEKLVQKVSIEYGLMSNSALNNWANNDGQCTNGKQHFKIAETDNDFPCIFKTHDGLWWNIRFLDQTIVAFKKDDATLYNGISRFSGYKAFMFVTEFDKNGSIRVNDEGYAPIATSSYYETSVNKVRRYLDGDKDFDTISTNLLDKYSTPCNTVSVTHGVISQEPTNVPCYIVQNDGKNVKIYIAPNNVQDYSYTTVTLSGCTNGENCTNVLSSQEMVDNKDGTYTQFSSLLGGRINYIRKYKRDSSGWFYTTSQNCDSSFSSCSKCTKYDSFGSTSSGGYDCPSSEFNYK